MRRHYGHTATTFALLFATLTGCGGSAPGIAHAEAIRADHGPSASAPSQESVPAVSGAAPQAPGGAVARVSTTGAPASPGTTGASSSKDASKHASSPAVLIMYTGSLSMLVDESVVASSIDKMVDVAEGFGGHLAGRTDGSVTLKVPSTQFRAALTEIEKLGTVTNRSVAAEDVTEEYKDAEVRLANMKATRARIQEFLARAANVNDMLTLEQQLERVSLEIDRIEGRMRFLRERTAFSTISIHVAPRPLPIILKPPPPPPPPPPAPVAAIDLPVKWLEQLGAERLMQVKK